MKKHIQLMFILTISSVASVIGQERIIFTAPFTYPEGVAYDSKGNNFYVSSVKTGTIGKIDGAGIYKIFYADSTLKSSFGMKVDPKRNVLWTCVGDPNYSKYSDSSSYKKMGKVIGVDLTSGKKSIDVDLASLVPGKHFPNDLALDKDGNLYITDSFSPVIYKVDAKGKASIFAKNELFESIDVGLNGIVFHPDGYLLVDHNTNGSLLKVSIKDPSKITKVKLNTFFPGADGLLLDEKNNLVLVQNKGVDKVFLLTSKDGWQSAQTEASTSAEDRFQNPTTAALNKGEVYVLNSKMNELSDSTRNPSKEFSIQKVRFKPRQ